MRKKRKLWLLVAVLLVLTILLTFWAGCNRAQKKPQLQQKPASGQKSKPPKELTKVTSGLEELYQGLKPPPQVSDRQAQGQQGQAQSKPGGQQGQTSPPGKPGQQQGQAAAPTGQIKWSDLTKKIALLHQQWNSYEPKAVQAGTGLEVIAAFEKEIDTLPKLLNAQDRQGARESVNRAALALPDLYHPYTSTAPPELMRLRYQARGVALAAEKGDWPAADSLAAALPTIWSRALAQAKGIKSDQSGRVGFSLTDLRQAVASSDRHLVEVKEMILEQNLKQMEKSLSAGS